LPAAIIVDAVGRLVDGVLPEPSCYEDESIFSGLLEYPQYTRPEEYEGKRVPEILLSGHHANIQKWKREQSIERTKQKRPDLYEKWLETNEK
jgi:tRNA (guanine37-N1)-methyltransferase